MLCIRDKVLCLFSRAPTFARAYTVIIFFNKVFHLALICVAKIYPNNDSSSFDFLQRSSKQSRTVDLKIDMGTASVIVLYLRNKGRGLILNGVFLPVAR